MPVAMPAPPPVLAAVPVGAPFPALPTMRRVTLRVILQAVLGLGTGSQREEIEGQVQRLLAQGRSRFSLILLKVLPVRRLQRTRWLPFYRQMHLLNASLYALIAARRALPPEQRDESVLSDLLAASQTQPDTVYYGGPKILSAHSDATDRLVWVELF